MSEDKCMSFYSAVLIELRWTGHGGDVLTKCGPLEKAMENHFSILAWKIPWTVEPGRLVHGIAKSWT